MVRFFLFSFSQLLLVFLPMMSSGQQLSDSDSLNNEQLLINSS
ncbi:hypothetical protein [Olivibacter sitiensis]|nr:hypothetical protein [Olivibacter sitiensis]